MVRHAARSPSTEFARRAIAQRTRSSGAAVEVTTRRRTSEPDVNWAPAFDGPIGNPMPPSQHNPAGSWKLQTAADRTRDELDTIAGGIEIYSDYTGRDNVVEQFATARWGKQGGLLVDG